jgi:hypothetical protein
VTRKNNYLIFTDMSEGARNYKLGILWPRYYYWKTFLASEKLWYNFSFHGGYIFFTTLLSYLHINNNHHTVCNQHTKIKSCTVNVDEMYIFCTHLRAYLDTNNGLNIFYWFSKKSNGRFHGYAVFSSNNGTLFWQITTIYSWSSAYTAICYKMDGMLSSDNNDKSVPFCYIIINVKSSQRLRFQRENNLDCWCLHTQAKPLSWNL